MFELSEKFIKQPQGKLARSFLIIGGVFLISIVVSFCAGLAAIRAAERMRAVDAVSHKLETTLATIKDIETNAKNYLLTGDATLLSPYNAALSRLPDDMKGIQAYSDEGILPHENIKIFTGLVKKKISKIRKYVSSYRRGEMESAPLIASLEAGDNLSDASEEIFHQQSLISGEAEAAAHRASYVRECVYLTVILLNFALLLSTYRRMRRDVADNYIATLEVRRQREILSVTLASIGDAVILADMSAKVTYLNPIAEQLTGWTLKEAKGRPCTEVFRIIDETTRAPVESPIDKVLASGRIMGLASQALLIRKDGSEIPIDDSGAPIREVDGVIRGVVLAFRDFTAHKEAERLLIRAKEQVETASKAKDHFIAMLSHELRTPLTPLLVTLKSWIMLDSLPSEWKSAVQMMYRNVELEARLIDDLLDVSRIEHGKMSIQPEQVKLKEHVEGVMALYRLEAEKKDIQLSFSCKPENLYVEADPARIQQVFWNLLGNAIKFTPPGGKVSIDVSSLNNKEIKVTFRDNGQGMSPEVLRRAFGRFEQGYTLAHQKNQGLGLGLTISKALIESHGGTLEAASEGLGRGSTFTIILPQKNPHKSLPSKKLITEKQSFENLNILLLEDHVDTAQVMSAMLSNVGHNVSVASTIAEGLDLVRQKNFDIILSDVGLPDGTGMDFLRETRKMCRTPAVALTGYGMEEDIANCLEAGFDLHLTKPIDFNQLQMAISKVIPKSNFTATSTSL